MLCFDWILYSLFVVSASGFYSSTMQVPTVPADPQCDGVKVEGTTEDILKELIKWQQEVNATPICCIVNWNNCD